MADPLAKNLLTDFSGDERNAEVVASCPEENSVRQPMRVYLRIRPFTESEIVKKEDQGCISLKKDSVIELSAPKDSFSFKSTIRGINEQNHEFSFSQVFKSETTQKAFFDCTMLPLVQDVLDGQNGLVFTYGVTNSGKTYTVQGTPKDGGILPRALDVIFNSISKTLYKVPSLKPVMFNEVVRLTKDQQLQEDLIKNAVLSACDKENIDLSALLRLSSTLKSDTVISNSTVTDVSSIAKSEESCMETHDSIDIAEELRERIADGTVLNVDSQGNVKFGVWVSFMEIYNEQIFDLLDPTPVIGKGRKRPLLKLGDDKNGNPYVKGLREIFVASSDEAYKALRLGQRTRHIASTKLNQHSSRSHSIFTIKLLKVVNCDQPQVARMSRISIVDLAGSERYCKTNSAGDRLKEASNINNSIMTLGKCIQNLRYNQLHPNHPMIIPFRESKLTRLFQSFFLGKGKASMVVNISQCASVFDETYHVLKFSAIAKQVTLKAERTTEMWKAPPMPKGGATPAKQKFPPICIVTPATAAIGKKRTLEDPTDFTYEELVHIVAELRDKVKAERRKNAIMEREIRKELCAEMTEQLVEIQNSHNERMAEQRQILEEQSEQRLELLSKTVSRAMKKKRKAEDDEEECVPVILLHAERMKCKGKDEEIVTLNARIAELESEHEFFKQTRTPEHHSQAIKHLEAQLSEAQETLRMQAKQFEEVEITMLQAAEALEDREEEIEKLKVALKDESKTHEEDEVIRHLKNVLEVVTKELETARLKLDERDKTISELQLINEGQRDEISKLSKASAQNDDWNKLSKEKNEFLTCQLAVTNADVQRSACEIQRLNDELHETKEKLKECLESVKSLQFEKDEADVRVEKYLEALKEHQSALTDSEAIIEQLNEQVSSLRAEVAQSQTARANVICEVSKDEESKTKEELCFAEAKIKQYSEKITRLERQLQACDDVHRNIAAGSVGDAIVPPSSCATPENSLVKVLKNQSLSTSKHSPSSPASKNSQLATIKKLEGLLNETSRALEKKTAAVVTKTNRIQTLEAQLAQLESKTLFTDMKNENASLSKQVEDLKSEIIKLQFQSGNQEETILCLNDEVAASTAAREAVERNLKSALFEVEARKTELTTTVEAFQHTIADLRAQLLCAEQLRAGLENEISKLGAEKNDLNATIKRLKGELMRAELDRESFKMELMNADRSLAKTRSDLESSFVNTEKRIELLQEQVSELQGALRITKKNLETASSEKLAAEEKATSLVQKIGSLEKELSETAAETEKLMNGYKSRIRSLETEVQHFETERAIFHNHPQFQNASDALAKPTSDVGAERLERLITSTARRDEQNAGPILDKENEDYETPKRKKNSEDVAIPKIASSAKRRADGKSTGRKTRSSKADDSVVKVLGEVTNGPRTRATSRKPVDSDISSLEGHGSVSLDACSPQDISYVLCTSIALSPLREDELDLDLHQNLPCPGKGREVRLKVGEFVAVKEHERRTHKPIVGKIIDIGSNFVRMEWWSGGYTKAWTACEGDEIESFPESCRVPRSGRKRLLRRVDGVFSESPSANLQPITEASENDPNELAKRILRSNLQL